MLIASTYQGQAEVTKCYDILILHAYLVTRFRGDFGRKNQC